MTTLHKYSAVAVGGFCLLLGCGNPAKAGEDFYRGRTITLIVAAPKGAGYYSYARLFAAQFGGHIPGKPTVRLRTMSKEGGILATNFIYNIAPKDGSVLGMVRRSAPLQEIVGTPGVSYRSEKLKWIGSLDHEVAICTAMRSASVRTIAEIGAKPLTVGVLGPSYLATFPAILKNTLGVPLEIAGYFASPNDIARAMERGEVDAMCSSYSSQKLRNPEWFAEDKVHILVQLAKEKHRELPRVPNALDIAKEDPARTILRTYAGALEMGRPVVAPGGVPAHRIALLRRVFMELTADETFLEEARKQKLQINPRSGENVQAMVGDMAEIKGWIRTKLKEDLKQQLPDGGTAGTKTRP